MLSHTSEYALRAMACLAARPDVLTSTPFLAEQTKVPANYLAKVLQQLAGAELIEGRRGVGGGYRLARPAAQITLLEVVNAVSQLKRLDACPTGAGPPLCPLHRKVDEAVAAVMRVLEGTNLQNLLDDPTMESPLCTAAGIAMNGRD